MGDMKHDFRGPWSTKDDDGGAVPAAIKALFDGLKRDIAALRTKHSEEIAEVKKRGAADVITTETVKRIEDGVAKAKTDIDELFKRNVRPAIVLPPEIAAAERKADLEMARWINPEQPDLAKGAKARREYAHAVERLIRVGERKLDPGEVKALQVGSAPDGGLWVEPQRADFIVTRMRETSNMRNIASVTSISSSSIKIPIDRDDVGYGWVGENSSRTETTTPQIGEEEISVHEIYAEPHATQNMIDDAGFDVQSWINAKVADRFARAENTGFVSGAGVKTPRGFLAGTPVTTGDATRAFGTLQYIATGVSGGFAVASATVSQADKMLDLIFSFNAAYRQNLRWTGNKTTLGAVRKFKNQQGDFIYDAKLSAQGVIDVVLGYPWEEFSDMADFTTANAFAVALGDWKRGYLVVDRQGIRQMIDPFTTRGRVKFYTTKRVGGAVVDSDAIKLLKFGTS